MTITVSAFYKFVTLDDVQALRDSLFARLSACDMRGTILVAPEGINGTLSGTPDHMAAFLAGLRAEPRFADLVTKEAKTGEHPFQRLKVKIKAEIIALRRPEADPTQRVGTHVAPEAWNALISDPGVLVIDTRNAYEVAAGTFQGAIDPGTPHFGAWPDFVEKHLDPTRHTRIAMFCTGGIRCEKASAYLLAHGFKDIYQLDGGILAYLAKIPAEQSLWQGRCFVFDERQAIDGRDAEEST